MVDVLGSSTLTVGGVGVITYGPATYTFDGPSVQGPPAANLLLSVTNGSVLVLQGTSTVAANAGVTMLRGGTLVLDNTNNNASSRLPVASGLQFQSGSLELRGNTSAATSFSLGALTGGVTAGMNTIRLTPDGAPFAVNFNNTGSFSTRLSTSSAFQVVTTSGVLGGNGANDPKMTFTGTPTIGANGLLANSAGQTFGYFTISDANGIDFATWNATDGVKAAGATLTNSNVTGAGSISTGTGSDRVFFIPGTGTQSASGVITNGSLRITPTAAGGTLAMGANNLQTVAMMLNGNNDFAISGTGIWASNIASRYVYVNNPNVTMTTSLVIATNDTNNNPTNIVGPGFLELNGTGSQNTATTGRINLLGGTLRANSTQFGYRPGGGFWCSRRS